MKYAKAMQLIDGAKEVHVKPAFKFAGGFYIKIDKEQAKFIASCLEEHQLDEIFQMVAGNLYIG